jgi:RNA polymerase sigma-70 factor (ECF subfamily)
MVGHRVQDTTPAAPDEMKIAGDIELLVESVVKNMPGRRQKVFELSYAGGLSSSDIAYELGLTPKMVDNQLYQARCSVRKWLSAFNADTCCKHTH